MKRQYHTPETLVISCSTEGMLALSDEKMGIGGSKTIQNKNDVLSDKKNNDAGIWRYMED